MHRVGTSDFQFFIDVVRLLLAVINLYIILRYGDVAIGVLSEFLIMHEKRVQELAIIFIFCLQKFAYPLITFVFKKSHIFEYL